MADAIAELYAELGVKVSEREFGRAEARLKQLDALAAARARGVSSRATNVVAQTIRDQERATTAQARATARAAALEQRMAVRQQAAAQRATDRWLTHQMKTRSAIDRQRQNRAAQARVADQRRQREAQASSAASIGMISGITSAVTGLALSLGGRLTSAAGSALIGFNASMEESKNQVAGMLALTKKTHLSEELANADMLVANLQKRAATLPGTTADYVHMLANITRPIADAKLGMQDLEDMTVASVVAAKAFGISADVAARDVDQALRGQYHSVDPFSGKVLGGLGYKGEEGRSRYNALSEEKRASEFKRGLAQPQIAELGAAQGKTFGGLLSTIQDTLAITAGRAGAPLFGEMTKSFKDLIAWINKNQKAVDEFADKVGGALASAFRVVREMAIKVYDVFAKHPEALKRIADVLGTTLGSTLKLLAGQFDALITSLDEFLSFMETDTGKAITEFLKMSAVITQLVGAFDALGIGVDKVFYAITHSSVIAGLIVLVDKLESLANRFGGGGGATTGMAEPKNMDEWLQRQTQSPGFALPAASSTSGVTIGQVSVGDIHVTTPSTDPGAVAKEARKVFGEELRSHLRKTMDQVS